MENKIIKEEFARLQMKIVRLKAKNKELKEKFQAEINELKKSLEIAKDQEDFWFRRCNKEK